jgi:pimeloyl-ACP methyl ester carboxylesterase
MKHLCAFVAIAISVSAHAAEWSGTWVGGTQALGSPAFVQVELTSEGGALRGTLELPSEDAVLPLRGIEATETSLGFRVATPFGEFRFNGELQNDLLAGRIKTPMGTEAPMHLRKTGTSKSPNSAYAGTYRTPDGELIFAMTRPRGQLRTVMTGSLQSTRLVPISGDRFLDAASIVQNPAAGKEYEFARRDDGNIAALAKATRVELFDQQPVAFRNGDVRLAGTLIVPKKPGPHAAAVVVHGSGNVTRDILLQRAQLLLREGVAVLLFDKRGTAESSGDWHTASLEDLAGDAVAAVRYLRTRSEIDPARLGIVGHSQAGWIVPIVVEREPKLAFAIVASGGGISPEEQELFRAETQTRNDFSAADAEQARRLTALMWTYGRTGSGWDDYMAAWNAAAAKPWFSKIGGPRTRDDASWTHIRLFGAHDPLPYLRKMRIPTLVIFGVKDENVPSARAAELWRKTVPEAEIVMVPEAGHNIMVKQGSAYVYAPQYVDAMKTWLRKRGITSAAVF